MNRVIKFRVIYQGKVNGYEMLTEDGESVHWQWMALDLNPDGRERWVRGVFPNGFEYKREQFTGLLDKNGKEIYENDFIQNVADDGRRLSIFQIRWQQSSCGFVKDREDGHTFTLEISKYFEVIGNSHQNPELL